MGLCCFAVVVSLSAKEKGVRIQDGLLTYSAGHFLAGEPLQIGYDPYGYNYQGHMFEGSYANAYLGRPGAAFPPYPYEGTDQDKLDYVAANPTVVNHWTWDYRDVYLQMKWNDAWLSNMDCGVDGEAESEPDGLLDRYYGYPFYIGSGAWLTNHMAGTNDDGTEWDYFTKIIAVPADATLDGGI